jgi:hypothetical protein
MAINLCGRRETERPAREKQAKKKPANRKGLVFGKSTETLVG